jgi:hypothetical protein
MLNQLYEEAKEKNTYIAGKCVVGQWSAVLSEKDAIAFVESLDNEDFSTRSLHILYKSAGATFGLTSLKEHRNGNCSCR